LVKIRGKQIKQKLKADGMPEARTKLRDSKNKRAQVSPGAGRITVDALCVLFPAAMSAQAPKTIKREKDIIAAFAPSWRACRPADGSLAHQDVGSRRSSSVHPLTNFTFKPSAPVFRLAIDDKSAARVDLRTESDVHL
jgi:hypothetical protein